MIGIDKEKQTLFAYLYFSKLSVFVGAKSSQLDIISS